MAQPRSRNNKRARVDEEATKEEDQDVRLCAVLRGLLGGSKYVKQSELSREVLLRYAIQKGDVVPVTLFTVTVEPLAGDIFDVKMEEKQMKNRETHVPVITTGSQLHLKVAPSHTALPPLPLRWSLVISKVPQPLSL